MPPNVAPADDLAVGQRNQLRVAVLDGVQHEQAGLLQRRRFEQREKFPFARDDVQRAMKALDVLRRNRDDGDIDWRNPAAGRSDQIAAPPATGREQAFGRSGSTRELYLAARSLGGSASWGSGWRAADPPENRAINHERNSATASLLRSSGWVVR